MLSYYTVLFISFAVITLMLTLYFTLLIKLRPSTEIKLLTYMEKNIEKNYLKKNRKASKSINFAEHTTKNETEEKECPHYTGYLTTLPKGSSFPDECFGCRKVIQCLRIKPTKVIESFYLAAAETE